MKREREPKPPEPWADPVTGYRWHSKPVAKSLYTLDQLGALVRESGRTDKNARAALLPFSVSIRVTPLTPAPHPKRDQHGKAAGAYRYSEVEEAPMRRMSSG